MEGQTKLSFGRSVELCSAVLSVGFVTPKLNIVNARLNKAIQMSDYDTCKQ